MTAATEIGARLKAERERLVLAQDSMAGLADREWQAQIDWERGTVTPDATALAAFAEAGADILFIVTGRRERAPLEAGQTGIADALRAIVALIPPARREAWLIDALALVARP